MKYDSSQYYKKKRAIVCLNCYIHKIYNLICISHIYNRYNME